jgi:hypothetical protein
VTRSCHGLAPLHRRAPPRRGHSPPCLCGCRSWADLVRLGGAPRAGAAGGWGLRLVAVTSCGAADRPIGSASARTATPGSLTGLPLSDGVGWVKVTVCRHRYFVRRRRHIRQQDSSRVSRRPACDAGCSMLHARVVFGRGWACVWRGAGGRGDDGGADWYALRNVKEASTDAVCSQDYQE